MQINRLPISCSSQVFRCFSHQCCYLDVRRQKEQKPVFATQTRAPKMAVQKVYAENDFEAKEQEKVWRPVFTLDAPTTHLTRFVHDQLPSMIHFLSRLQTLALSNLATSKSVPISPIVGYSNQPSGVFRNQRNAIRIRPVAQRPRSRTFFCLVFFCLLVGKEPLLAPNGIGTGKSPKWERKGRLLGKFNVMFCCLFVCFLYASSRLILCCLADLLTQTEVGGRFVQFKVGVHLRCVLVRRAGNQKP